MTRKSMETKNLSQPTPEAPVAGKRARYETPRIRTFSSQELLAEIGPPQGYTGTVPGTIGGGGL